MVSINNASAAIQWAVIRKNSAFLQKRRNTKKFFSTDPFNTTGLYTKHASGIANDSGVSIRIADDKKTLIVQTKKKSSGAAHKPNTSVTVTKFTGGPRRVVKKVGALIKAYEPSLQVSSQRRAFRLLRSVRPRKTNKRKSTTA